MRGSRTTTLPDGRKFFSLTPGTRRPTSPGSCRIIGGEWDGIAKLFEVPALSAGQRVFLEFEGAMQVAKVWVNGRPAGEHVGGYTGFVLDVTGLVKPDGENLLALSVDDTNSPDIPPANETNIAIYGGIYRDVWLHITGPVLIPDGGVSITTPKVSRRSPRSV